MDLRDILKKLKPGYEPTTIKATSAHCSFKVDRHVGKWNFSVLNTRIGPILEQSHRELDPDNVRGTGTSTKQGDER